MTVMLIGLLLLLPQVGPSMELIAYEADYEKIVVAIGPDGTRTESRELYRLYRDSKGRTRMEGSMPVGDETMRLAFIADKGGARRAIVDLATGTRMDFPSRRPSNDRAPGPKAPGFAPKPDSQTLPESQTVEDLGEREIEGLRARGSRTTSPSFGVSEVWHGWLIDQPPLLVKSKRAGEERIERLFNIRIGEPDAALFAPLDIPQE